MNDFKGKQSSEALQAKKELAQLFFNLSEFDKAILELEDCLPLAETHGPEEEADVLTRLGQVHQFKKVYGKALDFYSRALGFYEAFYGEKHEKSLKMF